MNYLNLEQFFENNELEKLLDMYKEDFARTDEYANLFCNNILNSASECQEALDVLTGLFMKFSLVFSIAEYQHLKVKELAKVNKDYSICVMNYLRIKNIFKAYLNSVKRAIGSSQSQLRYWVEEMKLSR